MRDRLAPTAERVSLPGGRFAMGDAGFYAEEGPVVERDVGPFAVDVAPVTNRKFARFVDATGYVTTAERSLSGAAALGLSQVDRSAGSAVFVVPKGTVDLAQPNWWRFVPGAFWRAPEGPASDLVGREDHPVVHVSADDAEAYAAWCGGRLPSEGEWEYAARAGHSSAYIWGSDPRPDGKRVPAVVWGSGFPTEPPRGGWGTKPVGQFAPNDFGLVDAIGQVWEWTATAYRGSHSQCCTPVADIDPLAPRRPDRVLKGGSFLCADEYCHRYRPAARIPFEVGSTAANVGFRCFYDN